MNIQELNLVAFGPFSGRSLHFGPDAAALHIVHGPNEAGKSSALRGLKALLYGIEERTPDNFLHANDKLRLQGVVRGADGQELGFARRKGRKNTLLTLAGDVLDEQVLAPFLGGVTRDLFATLFGIDHQALVQGGQDILQQKGEVGQALFSAALGSRALHTVLAQLDSEADGLFRPRGSTQTINSALKSYSELKKEIRDHSLSARQWEEQRRGLDHTRESIAQLQSELSGKRFELNRLQRVQRILPKFAARRGRLQELEALGDCVLLSDDFPERRRRAVGDLATARAILANSIPRKEALQETLGSLTLRPGLLEHAASIEQLHARLGAQRKAQQDRPRLDAERRHLLAEAESLLREVRPDLGLEDAASLRALVARRQAVLQLGAQGPLLLARAEQADTRQRENEKRLRSARKARAALPETGSADELRRAVAAARKLGDRDATIRGVSTELLGLQKLCAQDLSRLALVDGNLEDLPGLPVPDRPSIEHFEQAFDDLEKRCQRYLEKQQETTDARRDLARRIDEIQGTGRVPTEAELTERRSGRDRAWHLLRRQWLDGEDVSAEAARLDVAIALPDLFEARMAAADEFADRLRREADRVHALAALQSGYAAMQGQAADIARQLEACAAQRCALDAGWQRLWEPCAIRPRAPRPMRAWLDGLERLRERVGQLHALRQSKADLELERADHIGRLGQRLADLGQAAPEAAMLEDMLLACEDCVHRLDENRRQAAALDKTIAGLEGDLESAAGEQAASTAALETWETQWRDLIEGFGLPDATSPAEAADCIEKLRASFARQEESAGMRLRIGAIDLDATAFCDQVESLALADAPELAGLPADAKVMRLYSALAEDRSRQIRRLSAEEQLGEVEREIQEAEATLRATTWRLDTLCAEAGCSAPAELEEAERRSARFVEARAALERIEREIIEAGEGATVAELEAEAGAVQADSLPGRIEELGRVNHELEAARTGLAEAKGRQEKELELMDGNDRAAALAEQAQGLLAGIRSAAEQYVRVKLAGRLLRDEIERYRAQNQGPLLKRASEHFAQLTLDSFARLVTDFDARDEARLVGLRPGGARVSVQGMSSGTRDQLYLALRLASLEKFMESAEPMPFIVDDVLVDFDDRRSEAALQTLAALAAKTQVILFTHHSRLVDQAGRVHAAVPVKVHEL